MTEVNTFNYGNVLTNEKYCHFFFVLFEVYPFVSEDLR